MRTKLTVEDLRVRLAVRMAVAPRHLFKLLSEPKARPHERDQARAELVAFITHGWDSMEIDVTGPEPSQVRAPPTVSDGLTD